jgi:hypothetical protein
MSDAQEVERRFVICLRNDGYPASLEIRKVYLVIPDSEAGRHRLLRVIDESGEDYLYPEDYFAPIELPEAIQEALIACA